MYDEKKPLPSHDEKRGYSTGAKVAIGCGVSVLLGVVATCGGIGVLAWWGKGKVDSFANDFVARGYHRQSGQVIAVPGPVTEPTVYTAQVVQITGPVDADIAVMAQVVEIDSQVNGDIDFTGQVLHVKPGGVVKGNIRVAAAQMVQVQGTVEGQITGNYTILTDPKRQQGQATGPVGSPAPPKVAIPETPSVPEAPPSPEAPLVPQPPVVPE